MWFERDLPRLNVLLELLGDWVGVRAHHALFASLGRVKWVVDYRACFVAIDGGRDGGSILSIRGGAVVRTSEEELPSQVADVLTFVRTQRRICATPSGPTKVMGAPLLADGSFLGVMIFVAREAEPYGHQDVRFVEAIVDYFADAWWRIDLREREELQALESRRNDFLALLGHELRNPLAPMVTALELMKDSDHHRRERQVLERQVRHMTRLVDDLMDVARISRGRLELTLRRVVVSELLANAIEMARPALQARSYHVVIANAAPVAVSGDAGRLCQILINVLANAAKFSASGSTIRVAVEASSHSVSVLVSDEGEGIEQENLEKVFAPFVQLGDRALDRPGGGLGLGLALARELARTHGGELTARSAGLHQGSTFVLELPQLIAEEEEREEAEPAPSEEIAAVLSSRKPKLRVLVVDDNVDAAEMLMDMLEAEAFEVRIAHDGPSALRVAAEFEPDVGILDIGLPGMDGFELAAALRGDPSHVNMRLVALSGYGSAADILKGREAGFERHLVKPVDFKTLEKALRAA